MLYTGNPNQFNWQVNNYSDTWPGNTANGTSLAANASPHTKGSDTAVLAGIAEDCYAIAVTITVGTTDATIRRQMIDLLIDPAAGVGNAGSSWSVLVNNIYTGSPAANAGHSPGHRFYFPIYLKAGTALGARVQDVVGAATCKIYLQILGKPSAPESLYVGSKVETIGATTATTFGVTVVPGNNAVGSYSASLGTLTHGANWWQLGIGSADVTMSNNSYWWDVAHDATAKYLCIHALPYGVGGATELSYKEASGVGVPFKNAPAGSDVYVRAACGSAPDSSMSAVVYAVV